MNIIKNLKKQLTEIAKKNIMFRNILRKTLYCLRSIYFKLITLGIKVDEKLIIFSCFDGKSYACSPKAIYEYLLKDDRFNNYTFVWAFNDIDKYKELGNNKNTILVEYNSKKYKRYLAQAKYWIFNYKVPEYLNPKKNQVFLQCWHGTPLKRLGYDLEHFDNSLNTIKEMKKRYKIEAEKFSYFISPSKYATEKFISAWNLKEIGKEGIIIEKGYPRNDFLFNYTEEDVINVKRKIFGTFDEQVNNKKIILYAPTYRSNQHEAGTGYVYKEEINFEKMRKELGEEYIILFRPHYFIANQFNFEKYKGFVYDVFKIDDINELYIISDILITDYSSVFFDYANLKRPIIFYMYDLEHYRDKSNGFYINVEEELPGKIIKTDDDLIEEIKRVTKEFEFNEKYKLFNEKYNYLDDGQSAKRVIEECIKLD